LPAQRCLGCHLLAPFDLSGEKARDREEEMGRKRGKGKEKKGMVRKK
jgi:hypothetical protein